MSFSRYSIDKKQVSTDRGVTWHDVTPSETQRGGLVGIYRTLIECEDGDCDLDKTEYTIIDAPLPSEFCGETIEVLPEGIAKSIQFTAGALCCNTWYYAKPYAHDYQTNTDTELILGKLRCIHDFNTTYCPSFTYSANTVIGMEIHNDCEPVRQIKDWICPEEVCSCFQITEFMPWCENKTSWKLIQKQHFTRGHCSDEWEADGEPSIVGVGERWRFISDDFYQTVWRHEIATRFDDEGNIVEWTKVGSDLIFYNENNLESDLVLSGGVNSYDGYDGNYYYLLHSPKYNVYKEVGWAGGYKEFGTVSKDGNDFNGSSCVYGYVVYSDNTDEVITESADFSGTSLDLSNIKKATYGGCTTKATTPNNNTNNVTEELTFKGVGEIGRSTQFPYGDFSNLKALTKLTLEYGVKKIYVGVFCGNPLLKVIDIPSSVELINIRSFMDNTGLEKIIFRGITPPNIYTENGHVTFQNSNDCPVYVPDESVNSYISALNRMISSDRIKPLSQMTN